MSKLPEAQVISPNVSLWRIAPALIVRLRQSHRDHYSAIRHDQGHFVAKEDGDKWWPGTKPWKAE